METDRKNGFYFLFKLFSLIFETVAEKFNIGTICSNLCKLRGMAWTDKYKKSFLRVGFVFCFSPGGCGIFFKRK